MLDDEDIKRYKELSAKNEDELTDKEDKEMFRLEQESIEEDCMRMMHLGI